MATSLIAPNDGAITADANVSFSWSPVVGASSYNLIVDDPNSGWILLTVTGITGTSQVATLPHGLCRWTVVAVDGPVIGPTPAGRLLEVDFVSPAQASLTVQPAPAFDPVAASVSSSSGELVGYEAADTLDASLASFWSTPMRGTPQNEQITLDLGGNRPVGRLRIHPRFGTQDAFPADFEIQVSSDNQTFTTVHQEADYPIPGQAWQVFDFPVSTARYVRLAVTEERRFGAFYAVQIAELEVQEVVPPIGSVSIDWLAPGDDGNTGTAVSYDLRYAQGSTIDFPNAIAASNLPGPSPAGSQETVILTGLSPDTDYTFALRTTDNAGNLSPVSSPVVFQVPGAPPGAVTNLSFASATATSATITWSAPYADGNQGGAVAIYDLRYSTSPITEGNFQSAAEATTEPSPSAPGSPETAVENGLDSETMYYFALQSEDSAGNRSFLSNVTSGMTSDGTAPAAVTDLAAALAGGGFQVRVPAAVSASSQLNASYAATMATDGSLSSFWSTPYLGAVTTESITFDLGAPLDVARLSLYPRQGLAASFPRDFQIQLSLDNVNFSTVVARNDFGAAAETWNHFDFGATSARYVRLLVTEQGFVGAYRTVQLAEVQISEPLPPGVQLSWTAVGDNDLDGTATSYDVRYSLNPITNNPSFLAASTVNGEPTPQVAGSAESFVLSGLPGETLLYFAVRVTDDSGNTSDVSNSPSATTAGEAPARVTDLSATSTGTGSVDVSFTTVGDDGLIGTAFAYDLRYATSPIADNNDFANANQLAGEPAPQPAGSSQTIPVSGLDPDTTYYFALEVADELGNRSPFSNVASATTDDRDSSAPIAPCSSPRCRSPSPFRLACS